MSARNLWRDPLWQASELGLPIPDSMHAVSVALPRWRDVVGYEEKAPEVLSQLQLGYPRFVIHPWVREWAQRLAPGEPALPFPSFKVAEMAAAFVTRTSGEAARVLAPAGQFAVATTETGMTALRSFWQHTGLIVSSRQAEAMLAGRADPPEAREARRSLRRQLADFYDCGEDDIVLTPSGMAAQFAALRAVLDRRPGQPTAQLGFPYVDTLKLQQKLGHGVTLLHNLAEIEEDLGALLRRQSLAACFCEIPGNPLLGSVDVRRVTPILRAQGVPLVADDVVATPANIDLSRHADLIATSLTKYIAGSGDVMGGAVVVNPRSPFYRELKPLVQARHEELLWGEDASVLAAQARDFPERMRRHNQNGLWIAEKLRQHPRIEKTWYPKWEFNEAYEAVRRPDGGWGSLITFLPKNPEARSPGIYDRLAVCKGPSLGTTFTLACPFTLLAHYTELEWAESCGVSRHLIRISVGLEEPADLWARIERALE